MKYTLALFSLFLLSSVFSKQIFLDDMMSVEDQKRTGVTYLTPHQKIALEEWLNIHCNCSSETDVHEEEHQGLYLSINIDSGRMIQLNDNSIWEVDPRDYVISEAWLTSFPIKITSSNDPNFPFLLVNKGTGVSVRVKKIEMPPPIYTPTPESTIPSTTTAPKKTTPPSTAPKTGPNKSTVPPPGSVPMPPAPKPHPVNPPPVPPNTAPQPQTAPSPTKPPPKTP